MSDSEKTGALIPPLKDVRAVRAGAEAIGITPEEFADKFSSLANMFFELVTDDEYYKNKDYDQVILKLQNAIKEQDIKRLSTRDAFLCGAALGWTFSNYIGMALKPKPQEE